MGLVVLLSGLSCAGVRGQARGAELGITPLSALEERASALSHSHSHNDYAHKRPLLDALARGFASVEADVWLLNGKLAVAHNYWNIDSERTLATLYLAPLLARVRAHDGVVYAGFSGSLQLLIDVKSDGEETYRAIDRQLARYSSILTKFSHGAVHPGAVTAIITGNCALEVMAAQTERYAACDGRMSDLHRAAPASLMPLISGRWGSLFDWQGVGPMPRAERAELASIVRDAHAQGRAVRFWSTPDDPGTRTAVWAELMAAGVDYINTDSLEALRKFLSVHSS
jgi:hypothetical protein